MLLTNYFVEPISMGLILRIPSLSIPAQGKIASFARRVTRSCAKGDKKQCGIMAWHGINLWEPTLAVRQWLVGSP